MKAEELRELSTGELDSKLHDLHEELFSLRFKHKTQSISNPLRLRILRRDIARVLTIKREMNSRSTIKHEKET